MRKITPILVLMGCALAPFAAAEGELVSASAEGSVVYFLAPTDGVTVDTTFAVKFGLRGMGVAPAGIDKANTGHHHLLVDHAGDVDYVQPLPATDQLIHFGGGQTETQITLAPGQHTLQLVLGNYLHIPHDPPVTSEIITITVR